MKDASYLAASAASRQWQKISMTLHHGIAIPLFSIYSSQSYGIGEFTDISLLVDWCASIGFSVIQFLPLNDTGVGISPYSAISAFALNPLFLGIASLPNLQEHPVLLDELKTLPKFTYTPQVDYVRVRENKEKFLSHYYRLTSSKIISSEEFLQFMKDAKWIKGYAAFKILSKRLHESDWETWPESERRPTAELIETIIAQEKEEFNWFCFLQFLCYKQMKAAKIYADSKQVLLMGDIPILINRNSADVWLNQDLFDLQFSAGAPPDVYTEDGQNWGFPIYNWTAIAQNDYLWWRERLKWSEQYFHIYRIDHIVGFFRIWSIPLGFHGKDGHFIPLDETTWIDHGQRLMLMMLNSCNMLPIGEDLGVVPPEVKSCLSALGICGTKVMRWERRWKEDGQFIPIDEYPFDSMTTVSTHDSETLQQWWNINPIEAQLFAQYKGWTYQPLLSREYHKEILWDSHHTSSLFHINFLYEYLALIPGLSWPNLEDDRINIPGVISDKNWRYRLRISLEELTANTTLKYLMQELIR